MIVLSDGPVLVDDAGDPIDAGCPEHSDHWLAVACRGNRRAAGLAPQTCDDGPACAPIHEAERAHHDQVRADCAAAAELVRARKAAR